MYNELKTFVKKKKVHLFVLLFSMLIGGYSAASLGQDINFDLLNYHFSNPYVLLHDRVEIDVAVAELESYENPVIDVPSYLLISHLSPRQASTTLGLIQGINIWLIFEITLILFRRIKGNRYLVKTVALLVAVFSFFGAASTSEIGNSMAENIISIFILTALLILLYSTYSQRDKKTILYMRIGAYLVVGLAVGLKLTAATYAIGLLFASIIFGNGIKNRLKHIFYFGCAVFTGILISAGFWYLKLWNLYRNPIFPFYNAVFKSSYYKPMNFVDLRWYPDSIVEKIFYPFYFINNKGRSVEVPFRDPRLAVLFGLILLSLALLLINLFIIKKKYTLKNWKKEQIFFWTFLIISYLVWLKQFSYYRYLLPVEMISLTAIALIVFAIIKRASYASAITVICLILIATTTTPIDWGRTAWRPTYFGVKKSDFMYLQNSTILMAGMAPLGFLVPYFPASSQTIRVESDLSSPIIGTLQMQARLRALVDYRASQGTPFYGIRADEEQAAADASFKAYEFKPQNCKEITAIVRENNPNKLRICELVKT